MIDLKETFDFLNKNNLTFEELGILLTIYYKNESKDIAERAKTYYAQSSVYEDLKNKRIVPIQYKDIVENLIEKGFIEDYRSEADKDANKIMLNKIKVTELFTDIYFVKKSDAYEYAKSLFPKMGKIEKPGKIETYSAHAVDNNKMKEYFYTTLLQGGQKKLFEEFCYITKEIYEYQEEYDNQGNVIGGSPQVYANVKFDKYLLNFKDYKEEWEKNNNISNNNYNQFI